MSSYPHTSSHERPAAPRRSGIEVSTLLIAGLSAVIAAYVVSQFWAAGTIWATAFTPILVSLVKEALERPAQKVSQVATRAVAAPRTRPYDAAPPPPVVVPHDAELSGELSERTVYGRPRRNLPRRWRLAVLTGLIAFVAVVALYTLPELVAGQSVTSGSSHTTFFGGKRSPSSGSTTETNPTKTVTTTRTTTTPAQTTPTTTTTTPAQTTPTTTTTTPPAQTPTTPAAPPTTTPAP